MGPELDSVPTAMISLPGPPFGVVTTKDGHWSFVSLPDEIAVISTREFVPDLASLIPVPGSSPPLGETLTADGAHLLAAWGSGALVISVARALDGSSDPVLGALSVPGAESAAERSAVQVATSRDDSFAFVTREHSDDVAIFDLRAALASDLQTSGFIGTIPMGRRPVGMAVSPDGRWLYATSQLPAAARSENELGILTVVDLRIAESQPAKSVVAIAEAGGSPVRVAVSLDGRIVWVTARGSNDLLAFSASRLLNEQEDALVAVVRTGEAPVGVVLVDHGRRVVVANSNRFGAEGAKASLSVIDAATEGEGRPALLGSIRTGGFPREFSLSPSGRTLLVTNALSCELQAVDVTALP